MTYTSWMIVVYILQFLSFATWVASMMGIGVFILWIFGRLECRNCRDVRKRIDAALARPPRADMLPMKEWMDKVIELNTRPK